MCSSRGCHHIVKSSGSNEISTVSSKMERLLFISVVILILSVATPGSNGDLIINNFNVMKYGAVGDGSTDDAPAFVKAWKDVCQSNSQISRLIVPARTFLLGPVIFKGPCKSQYIYIQLSGKIVAPKTKGGYSGSQLNTWLGFNYVEGLIISGKGTIDGRGSIWWDNPCLGKAVPGTSCRPPTALTLYRCNRFALKGITHVNPARSHITLTSCKYGKISNIRMIAPGDSPNTDGIDISGCKSIQVLDSFIGTGDDCIAISGGSSRVHISGITCGPGHGISIGSLGTGGDRDIVEDVTVRNCTITETLTGVRIKTWQGGVGYARRIKFEGIRFVRANNPIIIDQFYCPHRTDCKNETKAVRVSDVTYRGIVGTSLTKEAIKLNCDQNIGCPNLVFDRVYLSSAVAGQKATAFCHNARGTFSHTKPTLKNCLLPN